jgi:DNA-binding GntR family transcriptional regulator
MPTNATLSSICVSTITDLIYKGELLPGDKIKGEYLKNRLNVGLSPIREALSRLSATGLVEFVDNVGFRVSVLNREIIGDTYESYTKIEILMLQEAIENGNEDWEATIMGALHCLSKVESRGNKVNYKVWNDCNEKFHQSLISGCNLRGLCKSRQQLLFLKDWYNCLAYKESDLIQVNHSEHKKIAELVINRQADSACTLLYRHTMHGLESLISKLKEQNLLSNE